MTARRLRVLEVAARYLPDLGGIESHIHEVTARMTGMPDLDVTVLATDRSGRLASAERTGEGFEVLRRRAYPSSRDYYLAPGIAPVIRRGGWDIVHFQGVHTLVPPLGMLAALRARVPYLLTFHSGGHSSATRNAARGVQWKVLTPMLRRAERLIAVSRFERSRFAAATGIPLERFDVIRNGGSLPALTEAIPPVPGRIVSSGRLERYKGHHRVIAALPILRRTVPTAHLLILGAGPYEAELRALVTSLQLDEHVEIRQVPPDDRGAMARELASARIVAALSDYEAHPVAVMEALTLGRPVVGLQVAGIADLVEDGFVTGLQPDSSPADTAAVLRPYLDGTVPSPGRQEGLPDWDSCAEQLADVYRAVASR